MGIRFKLVDVFLVSLVFKFCFIIKATAVVCIFCATLLSHINSVRRNCQSDHSISLNFMSSTPVIAVLMDILLITENCSLSIYILKSNQV